MVGPVAVLGGAVLAMFLSRVARSLPRIPVDDLTTTAWAASGVHARQRALPWSARTPGLRDWSAASIALVLVVLLPGWSLPV